MLFKVPRHYFETHSSIFADIFSLPQGENDAEGSNDEKPFVLELISEIDFRRLLMVIYPEYAILLYPVLCFENLLEQEPRPPSNP